MGKAEREKDSDVIVQHGEAAAFAVWPPALIVALQFALSQLFDAYGSTHIHSIIGNVGVHAIGALALMVWWGRLRAIPWRERRNALLLVAAVIAALVVSQLPTAKGRFLVAHALPALTLGVAAIFVVTRMAPWRLRRVLLLAFLVLGGLVYCLMRIQFITGEFQIHTAWRWEPHSAQQASDAARPGLKGVAALPGAVGPLDWPGFRGPARDGHVKGVSFAVDPKAPPQLLWRRAIGPGHGSMAIVGEYLFTQEQSGDAELVACYNAKTGEPVWTNSIAARHDDALGGEGPRATPTYADGKIYAQSGGGLLQCLDARSGEQVWAQELATPEAPEPPMYGYSSSPLVVDDLVLQFCSGGGKSSLIAVNATSGAEVWSAAKGTGGYGSPHLATLAGTRQTLLLDSTGLQSFEPATGASLWRHAWPMRVFQRCLQPLVIDETAVLIANNEGGAERIRLTKDGASWKTETVWANGKHRPYYNDDVAHEGFLYGFDGNRLNCVDLATGEAKWQGERCGGQLVVVDDIDLLLVITEKGKALFVKADPSAYTTVASFDAIAGKTWNHPAVAHGHLYVRNSSEMACYALPGAST